MDYALLERIFQAYLSDQTDLSERIKRDIERLESEDAFEQKLLNVFTHIADCFAVNESLKEIVRKLLAEADYFSKQEIHKTTKTKFLEKILRENQYREKSKQFNLNAIQTYVAHVVQKQLYEINIKIEENQRSLNKLESSISAADRRRLSLLSTKEDSHDQTSSSDPLSFQKEGDQEDESAKGDVSTVSTQPSYFLLVENEKTQCVIRYDDIVEILKFDKPVPTKILMTPHLPHQKLLAFNRRNVLKEMAGGVPDKKTMLTNANATVKNNSAKHFGLIIRNESGFCVLFVDYIEYTEPVSAYESGGIARREDEAYQIMLL